MNVSPLTPSPSVVALHPFPVKIVRFSNSAKYLATGDTDLQIKVWSEGKEVLHIDPKSGDEKIRPTENIRGLEFSKDETMLYVAASDTINAYSIPDGQLVWMYRPPRHFGFLIASPQALAVSSEGLLAASFDYGSLALFDAYGSLIYRRNENSPPRFLSFTSTGESMVGAEGFHLCVWDTRSGEAVHRWQVKEKIFAMTSSSVEPIVATRELYTMSIYNVDRFEKICSLPANRGLPGVAFCPRGDVMASAEKSRIRLINMECRGVQDFHAGDRTILTVNFTPDGNQIVAGCDTGEVIAWDRD